MSPALAGGFFTTSPPGKPLYRITSLKCNGFMVNSALQCENYLPGKVSWCAYRSLVLKAKSTSGLRSHMIILLDDDITLSRVYTAFLSTSLDNLNFNRKLLVMMLFTTFLGQKAIIILEGLWWYLKEATGDHRGKRLMFSWAFQNLQVPISFI